MKKLLLVSILSGFTLVASSAFAADTADHAKIKAEEHQASVLLHDFNKIDSKKSGKISKDEVEAFLAKQDKMKENHIAKAEKKAAAEKDAKKKAAIEKRIKVMKDAPAVTADDIFEQFDMNKDGFLTKVELTAGQKKLKAALKGKKEVAKAEHKASEWAKKADKKLDKVLSK